jgi:hypothetical protein
MWIVLRWIVIHVNNAGSITPLKFPNVNLNIWINKRDSYFIQAPQYLCDIKKRYIHLHVSPWKLWSNGARSLNKRWDRNFGSGLSSAKEMGGRLLVVLTILSYTLYQAWWEQCPKRVLGHKPVKIKSSCFQVAPVTCLWFSSAIWGILFHRFI